MDSRNSQDTGAALMMAGMAIMFIVLFVFFAFVSFAMTILCIFAWRKPLTIGPIHITPAEARGFIGCGIGGAIALPPMVVLVLALLGAPANVDGGLLFIAGYTGGSLCFGLYCAKKEEAEKEAQLYAPPPPPVSRRRISTPVIVQEEPFRFASWDDDEANR